MTAVAAVTVLLVTVKVAVVAPAATVTDAGTVAAFVLLLVSATAAPPAGAAVVKVTVPVLAAPPVTAVGFSESTATPADGLTVRFAFTDPPLYVAVIVTDAVAVTAWLVAVNVAAVAPAGIVSDAGTFAALVLLLLRAATMPPAGAAVARVTVPVLVAPPETVAGFIASPVSHGFTASVAVCDDPLYVP